MSYAAAIKDFPNSVDIMFGLVSRKGVERALKQARQDFHEENARQYEADVQEMALFAKAQASKAARPVQQPQHGTQAVKPRP